MNLAYEQAMGLVLNKYTTGVTLNKLDAATGDFKPIIRQEITKTNKSKVINYSNPCID